MAHGKQQARDIRPADKKECGAVASPSADMRRARPAPLHEADKTDPSSDELDVGLDDTFPASDPVSVTRRGVG